MSRTQTFQKPAPVPVPQAMADYIIERVAAEGSVDRPALKLKFSDAQIDAHFDAATEIARQKGAH